MGKCKDALAWVAEEGPSEGMMWESEPGGREAASVRRFQGPPLHKQQQVQRPCGSNKPGCLGNRNKAHVAGAVMSNAGATSYENI